MKTNGLGRMVDILDVEIGPDFFGMMGVLDRQGRRTHCDDYPGACPALHGELELLP